MLTVTDCMQVATFSMRSWMRRHASEQVSAWVDMVSTQAALVRLISQLGLVAKLKCKQPHRGSIP